MPDPFDADRARRALDEVPAPDLWPEAQRRADDDSVVPLAADGDPRRPGRWLAVTAVAAVAVLAVGTTAVLLRDDDPDQGVAAGPTPTTSPVHVYQEQPEDCAFGVTGDALETGPQLIGPFSELTDGTNIDGPLGADQTYRIDVPITFVRDFIGERVEDVELHRGTAQLWLSADFVQVRWVTDSQDPCGSFSVTVSGGTEDANRHAAVDLAERVVLPSELDGTSSAVGTIEGDWQLASSSLGGDSTDGNGVTFTFTDGRASWGDGCNSFYGRYEAVDGANVRMADVVSTKLPCPLSATAGAVQSVMGAQQIEVTSDGVLIRLIANFDVLVLHPPPEHGGPAATIDGLPISETLPRTEWQVIQLYTGEEPVGFDDVSFPDRLTFSFSADEMAWGDGCNDHGAVVRIDDAGYLELGQMMQTLVGCPDDPVVAVVGSVMGSNRIAVRQTTEGLELSGDGNDRIILERA